MNIPSTKLSFSSRQALSPQNKVINNPSQLKSLNGDTVTFCGSSKLDVSNICKDLFDPDLVIQPETKGDTVNIKANLNVGSIENDWGKTNIKGCFVKASQIKNEQGMMTIHNSHVKADIENMWGVIKIDNSENVKTSVEGNITNQWGPVNITGATKENPVEVKGNVENTHRDINIKNAKISGNVIGSGSQINLENAELENLIIKDPSNLEGTPPNFLEKLLPKIKGESQEFVLKSGNTINGNVEFLSGNGSLFVEEGAEFKGEVIGGEVIHK